jgi:integrase/recombinase XerD
MEEERTPPKEVAHKIARMLKRHKPDYHYLKKVFEHVREELKLKGKMAKERRLPDLLTDEEMSAFCAAVREANDRVHTVMLKTLIVTGIRNDELASLAIDDVDMKALQIRVNQGKGRKDRYVPFPASFRGELAQYIISQRARRCHYLFETHRMDRFTTRWIREIVYKYARIAGLEKRIYPHLFRHQLLTHLAKNGIPDAKIQVISGHADRQSLALYQDLSLADIQGEYQEAMRNFFKD